MDAVLGRTLNFLLYLICSECDPMTMSTVSALAEARRTTYIRGRWVYTDNGSEQQYEVVEPSLPGNGDYSAYSLWGEWQ